MITIRKLQSLPPPTRYRKCCRLLEQWITTRQLPGGRYPVELLTMIATDSELPNSVQLAATIALGELENHSDQAAEFYRLLNDVRHQLLCHLDLAPGDWDLVRPAGYGELRAPDQPHHAVAVALYLDGIRSPFNLGSIIRTAVALGVMIVGVSSNSVSVDHRRAVRSAMGAHAQLHPGSLDDLKQKMGTIAPNSEANVIALEVGGTPIGQFDFPETGILVVGSEEFGVRRSILEQSSAKISIPMDGPKASLNVGVACGIALYAWVESIRRR